MEKRQWRDPAPGAGSLPHPAPGEDRVLKPGNPEHADGSARRDLPFAEQRCDVGAGRLTGHAQ